MYRARSSRLLVAGILAVAVGLAGAALGGWLPAGHPLSAALAATSAGSAVTVERNIVWLGFPAVSPHEFRLNSLSVGAPVADAFQLNYSAGSFTLDYERDAGGPVSTSFTVTLKGLVEWTDLIGNGVFEGSNIVQWTPLGSTAFGNVPIVHVQGATPNGTVFHTFTISSNTGDVILNLTIAQSFVSLPGGHLLTPMEAKLTLSITHDLARPADRLALQVGLTTDDRVAMQNESWDDLNHFSEDDRALNVTNATGGNVSSAFFSWSNEAVVDNATGAVVPSLASNETGGGRDLFLTYPRAQPGTTGYPSHLVIVHDPVVGVVSAAYESIVNAPPPPRLEGNLALYVVSAAVVAGIVVLTALAIRRRGR